MGFPGACAVSSTYELDGTRLRITMEAVPDATTVINMVHHSYFNLAGHASGDVLGQQMRIAGDFYVPVDGELMPTGEILAVDGTPFDFRERHAIGLHLDALGPVGTDVFEGGSGWDHNWCLRGAGEDGLIEAAEIHDPASGRTLRLRTTEPGLQMYIGGYLNDAHRGQGRQPLLPVRRLHPRDAEVPGLAAVRPLPDDDRPGRRDVPPRDGVRPLCGVAMDSRPEAIDVRTLLPTHSSPTLPGAAA